MASSRAVALWAIRSRLDDESWYAYRDARIAAVVAGVPFAADFDPGSLAHPAVPLGLVTAGRDRWLVPRFHSAPVAAACASCESVFDFPDGGHGALMSPLPSGTYGILAELIDDPPGFDRGRVPAMNDAVAAFFERHLLPARAGSDPPPVARRAGQPAVGGTGGVAYDEVLVTTSSGVARIFR